MHFEILQVLQILQRRYNTFQKQLQIQYKLDFKISLQLYFNKYNLTMIETENKKNSLETNLLKINQMKIYEMNKEIIISNC